MATKRQSGGFLSKVATLFRDTPEDPESELESRNVYDEAAKDKALKAHIVNKRRDDAIRRREFDYLRSLRKSPKVERMGGDPRATRPSVFQSSSSFGADERASTLEKIDEIEADIFQTWAKSKADSLVYKPTPRPAPPEPKTAAPLPAAAEEDLNLDFTDLLGGADAEEVRSWNAPLASTAVEQSPSPTHRNAELQLRAAAAAAPHEAEVVISATESALQDAAIRYAEGDGASSAALLQDLYRSDSLDADSVDQIAAALFDLYRASGQHEPFDVLAMDYAQRFGRSPAEWFSLPDLIAQSDPTPTEQTAPPDETNGNGGWICPAVLDVAALTQLRSIFPSTAFHWQVDWSGLTHIDVSAAKALGELFEFWLTHPVCIQWSGSDALLQAMALHTPAEDKNADPLWWRLRLDAHCILQLPEAHDDLALDFCMVYEVSPPAWREPQCELIQLSGAQDGGLTTQAPVSVLPTGNSTWGVLDTVCTLRGNVLGEIPKALNSVSALSASHGSIRVRCALLARVDFAAAGEILNWTVARAEHGNYVEFEGVSHLIAALFKMVGLDKFAKISVRTR